MRIALMVLRNFYRVPYLFIKLWWLGVKKNPDLQTNYDFVRHIVLCANWGGNVTIESYGRENIPKENGFIFYPNHQGLYDVLAILESCLIPFAFVYKKEISNIILLKQVMRAIGALSIDREDVRASMKTIQKMIEGVKSGKNYLIFAEGTRSREGNKVQEFKAGSFKAALKAKCPIVPCALVDCFRPFDEKSVKPVTVKVIYLPPIPYEEYQNMKTVEIAAEVRKRIEEAIAQHTGEK